MSRQGGLSVRGGSSEHCSHALRKAVVGVLAIGALLFYLWGFRDPWEFGAVGALMAGAWFGPPMWRAAARSAFRHAEVHVLQREAFAGERIDVELILHPKRPLTLMGGAVKLIEHKYMVPTSLDSSRSRRPYLDELVKVHELLGLPRTLTEPISHTVQLQVPEDQPPTQGEGYARLFTTVRVEVGIDGWPDLELNSEIRVTR